MQIWGPDYAFLGAVEIPDKGFFVLLKTATKEGGELDCVMILEVDRDDPEISKHSFSVADESDIPDVFQAYCQKHRSGSG